MKFFQSVNYFFSVSLLEEIILAFCIVYVDTLNLIFAQNVKVLQITIISSTKKHWLILTFLRILIVRNNNSLVFQVKSEILLI